MPYVNKKPLARNGNLDKTKNINQQISEELLLNDNRRGNSIHQGL